MGAAYATYEVLMRSAPCGRAEDSPSCLNSPDPGHPDVDQHEVGSFGAETHQALLAGAGHDDPLDAGDGRDGTAKCLAGEG
jgi:hypothetical protein